MSDLETFTAEVEAYIKEHRMSATQFGREFLTDPGFVFGLRAGRDCRASTIQKVRDAMREGAEA